MFKLLEQFHRRVGHQQHAAVLCAQKTLGFRVANECEQVVEVAADIEQPAGAIVKTELPPRNGLTRTDDSRCRVTHTFTT